MWIVSAALTGRWDCWTWALAAPPTRSSTSSRSPGAGGHWEFAVGDTDPVEAAVRTGQPDRCSAVLSGSEREPQRTAGSSAALAGREGLPADTDAAVDHFDAALRATLRQRPSRRPE
jgi:hypothetical protein